MKDLKNKFYRNHSLIYKVLLFICTTFLIVYLFPKSGKFKYNIEKGKPWQSETLQAPFDFAIQKTTEEIENEKQDIQNNSTKYFELDRNVKKYALNKFKTDFNVIIKDSISNDRLVLKQIGRQIIDDLYQYGVVNDNSLINGNENVTILDNRIEKVKTDFSKLYTMSDVSRKINKDLSAANLSIKSYQKKN